MRVHLSVLYSIILYRKLSIQEKQPKYPGSNDTLLLLMRHASTNFISMDCTNTWIRGMVSMNINKGLFFALDLVHDFIIKTNEQKMLCIWTIHLISNPTVTYIYNYSVLPTLVRSNHHWDELTTSQIIQYYIHVYTG